MKSSKIKEDIQSLNSEISTLNKKIAESDNRYSELKANINLDDPKAKEELKALKSEMDLLSEIMQEKQKKVEALEENLSVLAEKEHRQKTIQQLSELAEKAERLEDSFHTKLKELDSLLTDKIPEIINARKAWEETAQAFMNLGDRTYGRGLRQTTAYAKIKSGKAEELTGKALLKELEEKGVNLRSVTSNEVIRSRYFTHTTNARGVDLFFGENIFNLMNQSNIHVLLEDKKEVPA